MNHPVRKLFRADYLTSFLLKISHFLCKRNNHMKIIYVLEYFKCNCNMLCNYVKFKYVAKTIVGGLTSFCGSFPLHEILISTHALY